jgi:5-methylcytosine-specific restriction endonuclease McrA
MKRGPHHSWTRAIDNAAPDGRERRCLLCDARVSRHRITALQIPTESLSMGLDGKRVSVEAWRFRGDDTCPWVWCWELPSCAPKAGRAQALRAGPEGLALPKPVRLAVLKVRREKAHRQSTNEIRTAVMQRAQGRCEGCGRVCSVFDLQMDHFFGGSGRRRQQQSVETCWALGRLCCHPDKTDNKPNAAHWRAKWREHCRTHGYSAEVPSLRKAVPMRRAS